MTGIDALGITALGLIAGVLIGCVGIGGVILVPALAYVCGIAIHTAIPAAMAAYLVSGAIGTVAYWRAGSVPWEMARPLFLAAMPAALAGALVSRIAPAGLLEVGIGLLTAASGLNTWLDRSLDTDGPPRVATTRELTAAGVLTGFASSLTGTGGPLVLVPILMWLRCPVLTSVGMAQVIQLPIALLATAGNLWVGAVDLELAAWLGAGLALGTWGGAMIAHAVPRRTLRLLVAVVLALVGTAIILKVGWRQVG
jgi:uncharacterized protein